MITIDVLRQIILALPTEALGASSAPVAYFVERFWGSWAGSAVALLTAVSGIGYVNSAVLLQGELPLTAVRGGMLPGIDEALTGMSAGDSKTFVSQLLGGELEGQDVDVSVTVNAAASALDTPLDAVPDPMGNDIFFIASSKAA